MAYTFNGVTKRITLSSGTVVLDLLDLHSRWKEWLLLGNAGYEQAFRAVGGDIPAIPLYLFILNGWRIVPQSADHTLTVSNGVFEVEGGGDPFVDPTGSYKIRINREAPGIAIGYSSSGSTGPTAESIAAATAAAVVAAIRAATPLLPVNMAETNGHALVGDGSSADKIRTVNYVG